jgi:hypothetical protein
MGFEVLGWSCFGLAIVVGIWAIGKQARRFGLLTPVAVGGGLRLAVMLVAHAGSVHLGDGGLMFLDDQTYFARGELIAEGWREGRVSNPAAYDQAGTYQFGYHVLLAGVFALVGPVVVAGKLVNVLLGTGTVLLIGLLARRLFGVEAARRGTWLAALAPTLVWWSAPLMKEALVTFLVVGTLLATTALPKRVAALSLVVLILGAALTRTAVVVPLLVGILTTLVWGAARLRDASWRGLLLAGLQAAVLMGLAIVAVSKGDLGALVLQYRTTLDSMIDSYRGSGVGMALVADTGKALVTPLPWVFDLGTRNWDRGLYPGMWLLYLVYPLALVGVWRMRRRQEFALLVLPVLGVLALNALSAGFVIRQRSVVEPLILVLAVAGAVSWRQASRVVAASLGVVALAAWLHSGSWIVLLSVASCALFVAIVSTKLSSVPLAIELAPSPHASYLTVRPIGLGDLRAVASTVARFFRLPRRGPDGGGRGTRRGRSAVATRASPPSSPEADVRPPDGEQREAESEDGSEALRSHDGA